MPRMANPEVKTSALSLQITQSLREGYVSPEIWELSGYPEDGRAYKISSASGLMATLFKKFDPSVQGQFREALTNLIKSWKNKKNDPRIEKLAFLAIDTHNLEAIEPLTKIVDEQLIPNFNESDEDQTFKLERVIGVIGGFGRLVKDNEQLKAKLKSKLSEWMQDPRLEKFAAMLLNAICNLDPASYPEYLPRFFDVLKRHPNYFVVDAVAMLFKREVPKDILEQEMHKVPPEYLGDFQKFLDSAFVPKIRTTNQT